MLGVSIGLQGYCTFHRTQRQRVHEYETIVNLGRLSLSLKDQAGEKQGVCTYIIIPNSINNKHLKTGLNSISACKGRM